jgi:type I restriction enzyme R subunit
MLPEARARQNIDEQLATAGWVIQDRADINLGAGLGVAVREFSVATGATDYLLYVDRKACGVLEAKPEGVTLTGFEEQSGKYLSALPTSIPSWGTSLIFEYESTGAETRFTDHRDPNPRSRPVFAFHRPEFLLDTLKRGTSLRQRLQSLPQVDPTGLRGCQTDAIASLEASLKRGDPRALVQMATGAGKTFTACNEVMRLLTSADTRRVLFLVDRRNLGLQTKNEFQRFSPPGTGKLFTEIYNVQLLSGRSIEATSSVVISTIQRLYAALRGEELDEELDETSLEELSPAAISQAPIAYNPLIPIEMFDVIIVDECHRSIYGVWRQVLDYFDAFIIGLTATPSKHTLGFFQQNLVSQYPYEQSVVDGVNVGYEIFRIRTERGEHGGKIDAGYTVPVRDRRTRRQRYEELEDDLTYRGKDLDERVLVPNQIRTVLQAYRDALPAQLFPDRTEVPKTLIFAKDDHHAEEIVQIARDVFGKGNEFCKKITYRAAGNPEELLKQFQTSYNPRIAVTVDMIATGTDIRPLEVLIFMRDVRSANYFEQMRGRGARTVNITDLRQVTPDAKAKECFVLIDAVGVTESIKSMSPPLERKRTVAFDKLLQSVASGDTTEDTLSSLAGRIAALAAKLSPDDHQRIRDLAQGSDLTEIAGTVWHALDPDVIEAEAARRSVTDEKGRAVIATELRAQAARVFDDPKLRRLLVELKQISEIIIDEISTDTVLSAGYDIKLAEQKVADFRRFIEENKDELTALQILYAQPYVRRHLGWQAVKDLRDAMARPPWLLQPIALWACYRRLNASKVRDASPASVLTDLVALVRYALGHSDTLQPLSADVAGRFNLWIGRERRAGREYSPEQIRWLTMIRDHVAANVEVTLDDLQEVPDFADQGGRIAANRLFGRERLPALLDELSDTLIGTAAAA